MGQIENNLRRGLQVRADRKQAAGRRGTSGKALPLHLSFGSPPVPQNALSVRLLSVREALLVHIRPILRKEGVTEQQYRILRTLQFEQPLDNATLAQRATLLAPSVSRILKDLRAAGLVGVVTNGRNTSNALTPKGDVLAARIGADIDALGTRVVAHLGAPRFRRLMSELDELKTRLATFKG
jgi:homoprotocatechuate degradation regulator HpaR